MQSKFLSFQLDDKNKANLLTVFYISGCLIFETNTYLIYIKCIDLCLVVFISNNTVQSRGPWSGKLACHPYPQPAIRFARTQNLAYHCIGSAERQLAKLKLVDTDTVLNSCRQLQGCMRITQVLCSCNRLSKTCTVQYRLYATECIALSCRSLRSSHVFVSGRVTACFTLIFYCKPARKCVYKCT